MKLKIGLFLMACSIGLTAVYACGYAECGGGNTKCCTDIWKATYYCPTPKPPVK